MKQTKNSKILSAIKKIFMDFEYLFSEAISTVFAVKLRSLWATNKIFSIPAQSFSYFASYTTTKAVERYKTALSEIPPSMPHEARNEEYWKNLRIKLSSGNVPKTECFEIFPEIRDLYFARINLLSDFKDVTGITCLDFIAYNRICEEYAFPKIEILELTPFQRKSA